VRSASAAPAATARWASAATSRFTQVGSRKKNESARLLVGRRRHFASENGAVNGTSGDDEGPSDPAASSLAASMQWRRKQIDKLENKFTPTTEEEKGSGITRNEGRNNCNDGAPDITSDEELQPMWRDMESRVTRRRSLTAAERGPGKVGRRNIRKGDEDVWLAGGLYNEDNDGADKRG